MNFVTLGLWFVLGGLLGLFAFIVGGFVTLPMAIGKRQRAATYYATLATKLIGRSVLVERGTKWDIFSTDHDSGKNADSFEMGGDEVHVTNETGLLSQLYKYPFGLIAPPEDNVSSYISPEIGELGEVEVQRREQGTLTDDDGNYDEAVTLSPERPLIRLREFARAMIPGSRALHDLSESEELYKQSQTGFRDTKTAQFMILVIAYAAGAGVTWLIVTQAGGTANAINVPSLTLMPGVGL